MIAVRFLTRKGGREEACGGAADMEAEKSGQFLLLIINRSESEWDPGNLNKGSMQSTLHGGRAKKPIDDDVSDRGGFRFL